MSTLVRGGVMLTATFRDMFLKETDRYRGIYVTAADALCTGCQRWLATAQCDLQGKSPGDVRIRPSVEMPSTARRCYVNLDNIYIQPLLYGANF